MTLTCCPTCGHPLPELDVFYDLTQQQARIFLALSKAGRAGLGLEALVDRVYADRRDGGPVKAEASVRTQVNRMNKTLRKHGLKIRTERPEIRRLEKLK